MPVGGGRMIVTTGGTPGNMRPGMSAHFTLLHSDTSTAARRGRLTTRHGIVETPIFMPVGTQGTVKAVTPVHLREIGAQIILGNTYHLNQRPGSERIRDLGHAGFVCDDLLGPQRQPSGFFRGKGQRLIATVRMQ